MPLSKNGVRIPKVTAASGLIEDDGDIHHTAAGNAIFKASDGREWPVAGPISGEVNVKAFGAVGDGVADDTAPIAAAFAAALSLGYSIYFPPGTYLTDTIQWTGQSIRGGSAQNTIIKGKANQDILYAVRDGGDYRMGFLRDIDIRVNATVDASGSFNRYGGAVGNAGIAFEWQDGSDPIGWRFLNWIIRGVYFTRVGPASTPDTACGMYLQASQYSTIFDGLRFQQLGYGLIEDYPSVNVTSQEVAPDHNTYRNCVWQSCGVAWRAVNNSKTVVENCQIYSGTVSGLIMDEVQSKARSRHIKWSVTLLWMEVQANPLTCRGTDHVMMNFGIGNATGGPYGDILIDCEDTTWVRSNLFTAFGGTDKIRITGENNHFIDMSLNDPAALVAPTAIGNRVEVADYNNTSDLHLLLDRSPGKKIARQADAGMVRFGLASTPFRSEQDLFWQPSEFTVTGVNATSWSIVVDSSAHFGEVGFSDFSVNADSQIGLTQMNRQDLTIGDHIPACKLRVYFSGKCASAATANFRVSLDASIQATLSVNWTTAMAVYSVDVDLSAATDGQVVTFLWADTGDDITIEWLAMRPYEGDILLGANRASLIAQGGVASDSNEELASTGWVINTSFSYADDISRTFSQTTGSSVGGKTIAHRAPSWDAGDGFHQSTGGASSAGAIYRLGWWDDSAASFTELIRCLRNTVQIFSASLGFYSGPAVTQPSGADQVRLTDSTGGTVDGTLAAVSGTGDDATINDNFADLFSRLDKVMADLQSLSLQKGGP